MVKANLNRKLSLEEVYSLTNGGYDIFMYYLGKVGLMNRPWGKKEKLLSFAVFVKGNIWYWKDFAKEESGDAIQFIQNYFSLSFSEAIDKVVWDFGLQGKTNPNPVKVIWDRPDIKEYSKIVFSEKKFEKRHHEFWNIAGVSEEHCNKYNCWAVKELVVNGERIPIKADEIVFAYYAEDIDRVKIYFPERVGQGRFLSNVPFNYLWNFNNLNKCDKLIITKSNKDLIVTSLFEKCVTCTQAEAVKIFSDEVVEKISLVSDNVIVWYGSDMDGVKKCKEITDKFGYKYINTPAHLLPEINDQYGYAAKFGINDLDKYFNTKIK